MRWLLLLYLLLVSSRPSFSSDTNKLIQLGFTNEPVVDVLAYLSDVGNLIVTLETPVSGTLTCAKQDMSTDDVILWLDAQLSPLGYTSVLTGRMLTVMSKQEALFRDIPVVVGNEPALVPKTSLFETQIIPVRFVVARQLMADLSKFVSPQVKVEANDAGNTLVITGTQLDIHHFIELVRAVDDAAVVGNQLWIFHLNHANPTDLVTELEAVFSTDAGTDSNLSVEGELSGTQDSVKSHKPATVLAVADVRLQSILVAAPYYRTAEVAALVASLDIPSKRDSAVYMFHVNNGDPQQIAEVLQGLFSAEGISSSTQDALMQRSQATSSTVSTTVSSSTVGSVKTSQVGQ